MKILFLSFIALFIIFEASASNHVSGYTRRDGTYVAPHYRSDANSSRFDNYSTRGNTNPYTGERGYVDPYSDY